MPHLLRALELLQHHELVRFEVRLAAAPPDELECFLENAVWHFGGKEGGGGRAVGAALHLSLGLRSQHDVECGATQVFADRQLQVECVTLLKLKP